MLARLSTLESMSIKLLTGVFAGLALLGLTACATGPTAPGGTGAPDGTGTPGAFGAVLPAPPSGDVIGQGMVMDARGNPELCLGPVAESYPPQCSGIPLDGWSWEDVEGSDYSGDTRWGMYAVQGEYDGTAFTVTQPPILLALYDPMAPPDPTGGATGAGDEDSLLAIQELLPERLEQGTYFSSWPERGYLWVDVLWDDGTLQEAADAEFGTDTVVIRSALREVD